MKLNPRVIDEYKYIHSCKFNEYCKLEYNRLKDKIIIKPCCLVNPINDIEPLVWDADFFVNNIDYCINEYSKFDLRNLSKYYKGTCVYKTYNATGFNTLCDNYINNKKIYRLENSTLRNCNLFCIMCRNDSGRNKKEDYIYLKILQETYGKYHIATTCVGEPFTLKEELFELLKTQNSGQIDILTNGTLLTKEDINLLSKLNVNNNIYITMSIDSDIPEVYEKIRQGAKFEVAYANLLELHKAKLLTNVHLVIQESNLDTFLDTEKHFAELGIVTKFIIKSGDKKLVEGLDEETKKHIFNTELE